MNDLGRPIAVLAIAAVALGGCGTITGRPFAQYFDDMKTTAKVKTRLASESIGTLTRTNVDTYNGVVYVNGVADTEAQKERLERAANLRDRRMVSHLQLRHDGPIAAARASDREPSASPRAEGTAGASRPVAGEALITGQVTSIDHNAGKLTLKTSDGEMDLRMPPSSLRNFKEGDRVSLRLAADHAAQPSPRAQVTK